MFPYSSTDPGLTSSQFEGNLDIEWAGAVAPHATIYYVYGQNAFLAMVYAVELDVAPVVSVSYSSCEVDVDPFFRSVAQQANAQGITLLAASGDAGAAGCDIQASEPFATRGESSPGGAAGGDRRRRDAVRGRNRYLLELDECGRHERFGGVLYSGGGVERIQLVGPSFNRRRSQRALLQTGVAERTRRAERQCARRAGCGPRRRGARWLSGLLQWRPLQRLRNFLRDAVLWSNPRAAGPVSGGQQISENRRTR